MGACADGAASARLAESLRDGGGGDAGAASRRFAERDALDVSQPDAVRGRAAPERVEPAEVEPGHLSDHGAHGRRLLGRWAGSVGDQVSASRSTCPETRLHRRRPPKQAAGRAWEGMCSAVATSRARAGSTAAPGLPTSRLAAKSSESASKNVATSSTPGQRMMPALSASLANFL